MWSAPSQEGGRDQYDLAATSEQSGKKKNKNKKDMDELKKEVDLVSILAFASILASLGTYLRQKLYLFVTDFFCFL